MVTGRQRLAETSPRVNNFKETTKLRNKTAQQNRALHICHD
jgi:hypothetical protein